MRIVEKEEDVLVMLESSRREAIKSFGDDRVLVEKYLTTPRWGFHFCKTKDFIYQACRSSSFL